MLAPRFFGENLFDEFMDGFFDFPEEKALRRAENQLYGRHAVNMMKTDVREHEDHYELDIDLPGFKKDELTLELQNGYLTISAKKGMDRENTGESSHKFVRRERYVGSMSRSFFIGDDVKQEDIHAKYENGVLKLSVPKPEPQKPALPEKKTISIEG